MKLFNRKPKTRRISVQSPTDCGHRLIDLPPREADIVEALQAKFEKLDLENEALVESAKLLADSQQDRINDLVDQKHRLRTKLDYAEKALTRVQAQLLTRQRELDGALAEVKRLDGKLVQVDCENLRLNGLLSTAEERLAEYRLGVRP